MAPTHVAVGLALALPMVVVAPELATAAAIGAAVGGVFPDLDLLAGTHRKTLHFPVAAWPVAAGAAGGAFLVQTPLAVGVAFAALAAAVHSTSDMLGAGEELRPWERTNPNAVYDHVRGKWYRARYVVRYDGSPEDLAVTLVCAVPAVLVYDGIPQLIGVVAIAIAVPYTAFRKQLAKYFARIV